MATLLLVPCSGFPQQQQDSDILSKNNDPAHYRNPLIEFADFIFKSSLYEKMMSSPDFIKVQDIARRLWDNQTGAKHRVRYSRRTPKRRQ